MDRNQTNVLSTLRFGLPRPSQTLDAGAADVAVMGYRTAAALFFLCGAQSSRLIHACLRDRLGPLIVLAIVTGAREGELLALTWSMIDLDVGEMRIRSSLQSVTGQGLSLGPCKTRRSRREVAITAWVAHLLRLHKHRQERETMSPRWHELEHRQNLLPRYFYPLLRKENLPTIHFHDLRHTAGYLMKRGGVPLGDISAAFGHSSIRTTNDIYGHTMARDLRDLANGVDRVLLGG